ncbi:hypothetical protein ACQEVF_57495 [Nonomuraea polychroma]|uniref:hypothetical protein n=1 Tax=Nonomuraea polychroma TaxID=46176 RepID=UPI003D922F74
MSKVMVRARPGADAALAETSTGAAPSEEAAAGGDSGQLSSVPTSRPQMISTADSSAVDAAGQDILAGVNKELEAMRSEVAALAALDSGEQMGRVLGWARAWHRDRYGQHEEDILP